MNSDARDKMTIGPAGAPEPPMSLARLAGETLAACGGDTAQAITRMTDRLLSDVVLLRMLIDAAESYSAHVANSAKRYVEKRFLRFMYSAWRAQERGEPMRAVGHLLLDDQ